MADLPEKVNVMIARFSYDGMCRVEQGDWIARTTMTLAAHPRVKDWLFHAPIGYPITAQRNAALAIAREQGFQYLVMCDNDMIFDAHSRGPHSAYDGLTVFPDQVPFLPSALDFALEHPGPCVIAAPYCAAPPKSRVLVHKFEEFDPITANRPHRNVELKCFGRDEAAMRTGFEIVAALPTGLMLIDTRICDLYAPPWFYYEFKDDRQLALASTEDVTFSRNLLYLGIPQYCAWSSWAAHVKMCLVGRPEVYPQGAYPMQIREQWEADVLRRAKDARPRDRVNTVAQQILREREAKRKSETDAAPIVPMEE